MENDKKNILANTLKEICPDLAETECSKGQCIECISKQLIQKQIYKITDSLQALYNKLKGEVMYADGITCQYEVVKMETIKNIFKSLGVEVQ